MRISVKWETKNAFRSRINLIQVWCATRASIRSASDRSNRKIRRMPSSEKDIIDSSCLQGCERCGESTSLIRNVINHSFVYFYMNVNRGWTEGKCDLKRGIRATWENQMISCGTWRDVWIFVRRILSFVETLDRCYAFFVYLQCGTRTYVFWHMSICKKNCHTVIATIANSQSFNGKSRTVRE